MRVQGAWRVKALPSILLFENADDATTSAVKGFDEETTVLGMYVRYRKPRSHHCRAATLSNGTDMRRRRGFRGLLSSRIASYAASPSSSAVLRQPCIAYISYDDRNGLVEF